MKGEKQKEKEEKEKEQEKEQEWNSTAALLADPVLRQRFLTPALKRRRISQIEGVSPCNTPQVAGRRIVRNRLKGGARDGAGAGIRGNKSR